MLVYGGCVEPGGVALDDDRRKVKCPACGVLSAVRRDWENATGGSINRYWSINCEQCGFTDGEFEY